MELVDVELDASAEIAGVELIDSMDLDRSWGRRMERDRDRRREFVQGTRRGRGPSRAEVHDALSEQVAGAETARARHNMSGRLIQVRPDRRTAYKQH
jgi:hypothetical protein